MSEENYYANINGCSFFIAVLHLVFPFSFSHTCITNTLAAAIFSQSNRAHWKICEAKETRLMYVYVVDNTRGVEDKQILVDTLGFRNVQAVQTGFEPNADFNTQPDRPR